MNADESTSLDGYLTPLLVACDQALAAGTAPPASLGAETPAELRPRLEHGMTCMRLLRKVLWRGPTGPGAPDSDGPFTRLGRFLIRRELGCGAFGMVFQAYDPQLGRDVALKVPRAEALVTPELRQRFVREARAAAGLDHPNLVAVYEVGEVGPVCYIASAYCPGVTLAAWLKERSDPVPVREAAHVVATLAGAVQHAHGRGVVHRDLKPANVLLTEDGVPRVTDFGLAKLTRDGVDGEGQTQSGAIVGTPGYMAPEQASGKSREVGPAADVYALEALLYELVAGRPPFRWETPLETLEQVRSQEPLAPRSLRPTVPRDLETICLKCLRKEPGKRYPSAAALAEDLRRFLAGEPIRARPVGRAERCWRWCRRRPAVAGLTAALVLILAGSFAAVTALWLRAEDQRSRAEESDRRNRAIVNKLYTLSEETLLDEPGLQPLRKMLLEAALEHLSLVGDDPKLRAELAAARQRVGSITRAIGSKADARTAFEKALEIRKQLVRENPSDPRFRRSGCKTSVDVSGGFWFG